MKKYIFVTGGVVSGLGKGITAASLGRLLKSRGLKVAAQKITTNRKNSPKIKSLLTSYGCGAISQLPEDKREAFLNDLAQL